MAKPMRNPKAFPTEKIGFLKRRMGIIGSSARSSMKTKGNRQDNRCQHKGNAEGEVQPKCSPAQFR